jgi:hypothetical protein
MNRNAHKKQKEHSLSQLLRFVSEAEKGNVFNALQFGYNLGRLQEMVEPNIKGAQKRWWSPVEPLVHEQKWQELTRLISGQLKTQSNAEFDEPFLRQNGVSLRHKRIAV